MNKSWIRFCNFGAIKRFRCCWTQKTFLICNLQAEIGSCTQHAEERLSNIRTVRIFAQEEREVERQNALLQKALQIMYQEAKMRAAFFGMVRYLAAVLHNIRSSRSGYCE